MEQQQWIWELDQLDWGGGAETPQLFSQPHQNWADSSGGKDSSTGFPASPPWAGLNNPLEEHFNQPPCLCLSWPLLSLSESLSIAGNPGSSTSRHFAPSQAEISQRAGLPSLQGKQTGLQAPRGWGWAGAEGGLGGGGGAASWLSLAQAPTLTGFPLPSAFPPRRSRLRGEPGRAPLSSGECSWLKPQYCSASPSNSTPSLPRNQGDL